MRRIVPLLLLALAGCGGTPGPQPAELTALDNPKPLRVLWSASLGDEDPFGSWPPPPPSVSADRWIYFPVLVGDAIYATSRDGIVVRLDAATGRRRWRASAEMPVSAGVGADATTVAVASEDGEVVGFAEGSGKVS